MDWMNDEFENGIKCLKSDAGIKVSSCKVADKISPNLMNWQGIFGFQFGIKFMLDLQKFFIILFQKFTEF